MSSTTQQHSRSGRSSSLLSPPAAAPGARLSVGMRVAVSVLVLLVFGLGDLLVLLFSNWPHLYGVAGVPVQRWEEITIYLPFAQSFGWSNLLPIAPGVDRALMGSSVYPWITMALEGFILKVLCFGSTDLFLFVNHSVLPLASFWLIYAVFRGYVSRTWAVLLAFLGVSYYSGFHYADAIAALLGVPGKTFFPGVLSEVTRMPFPSLTLPLFLLPLWLTLRSNRLSEDRLALLGVLWALQVHVYVFNFLAGASFFALWIIYARYVTDKGFEIPAILRSLGTFIFLCVVLAVPFYATAGSPLGKEIAGKLFSPVDRWLVLSDWGAAIGYLFPLLLLGVTVYLFRGDAYELFYRFTPVLIALLVDLLVGSLHLLAGGSVNPELYYHRISHIAFRFFYFVPFLYFIGLPEKHVSHREGARGQLLHQRIPDLLKRYVHRYRLVYAGLGIGLVGAFMLGNNVAMYLHHEEHAAPQMIAHAEELAAVAGVESSPDGAVVCESIPVSLLLPGVTDHPTLLAGTFGNFVENDRIIDRIVLHAKLCGWTTAQFTAFVSPGEAFADLSSYDAVGRRLDDDAFAAGLGYYLINHRKPMGEAERRAYVANLVRRFETADVQALLVSNPVAGALVRDPARCPVAGATRRAVGAYTYITF